MCYNISYIEKRAEKYVERFSEILQHDGNDQLKLFETLPNYYFVSGFSHPELPIIKEDGIGFYRWGLIPFWVKDADYAKDIRTKTLNAVGETVFEKPSFRAAVSKKRCILPINGFYEWRDFNKKKYPYFIKVMNKTRTPIYE